LNSLKTSSRVAFGVASLLLATSKLTCLGVYEFALP
jgi:hypothetical protein